MFEKPGDFLADDSAHASAHELEIHDAERDFMSLDRAAADYDCILAPGLRSRFCQALRIRLAVDESQRIVGVEISEHFAPGTAISRDRQALLDRKTMMESALQ